MEENNMPREEQRPQEEAKNNSGGKKSKGSIGSRILSGFLSVVVFLFAAKFVLEQFGAEFTVGLESVEKVVITKNDVRFYGQATTKQIVDTAVEEMASNGFVEKMAEQIGVSEEEVANSINIRFYENGSAGEWIIEITSDLKGKGAAIVTREIKTVMIRNVSTAD